MLVQVKCTREISSTSFGDERGGTTGGYWTVLPSVAVNQTSSLTWINKKSTTRKVIHSTRSGFTSTQYGISLDQLWCSDGIAQLGGFSGPLNT